MKSVVTIKLKIPCKKELLETMRQYSKSAQYVVDTGWENGIYSKRELHNLTYYPIREILELPAQLVCSSRDKACETLKSLWKIKKPTKPNFKEMLTIRYDARSFSFNFDCVSLATTNGRLKIPVDIPEYYWQYLDWDARNADLILDRKNKLLLHITFSRDIQLPTNSDGFLGVDIGINQVAVTSNRQFFNARQIKLKRIKFKRIRAKLQSKGTRSAKRLLKKVSGREQRFMRYWNHVISKQIVNNCKAGTIVLENLKGIRNVRKGRKFNFWLNRWSFYQLQQFITYKALRSGIKTIKVSPYLTSQTCSRCGQIGSRSKGFFVCSHCGYSLNADLNASFNLAKHHSNADGVSVPVTVPDIRVDEHKGSLRTIACETMDKSPHL
ncbi:MAG: transposase [Nanoarchaeota archaeon]|nr:transposase [Nanoarchaeota archaeon]